MERTIRVDVDFFDEDERYKLLQYPTAEQISQIVERGLQIPWAQFLTYLIWHRQRLGSQEYSDRSALARKLGIAENLIDGCVEFNGSSIRMPLDTKTQLTEIAEHVGEAIGLSTMDRIHGLTEADWHVLPEYRGRHAPPSLDYEVASDGTTIIQIETKGSSANDNRVREPNVREQKYRIAKKKAKLGRLGEQGLDRHPATLRYGTITVLDRRPDSRARCWLVDPEPEDLLLKPRAARLLSRMRFLRNWICFLSPRSQLASAIATRVADLEALDDPFALDKVPLLRGNGLPFEFETYDRHGRHASFFSHKSRVTDGPAGGTLLQSSNGALFFAGFREQLLVLAARQDFEAVLTYTAPVDTIVKKVECIVPESSFRQLPVPPEARERATHSNGYARFMIRGALNYSAGGLVFGFLEQD